MSEGPEIPPQRDWPLLAAAGILLVSSSAKGVLDGVADPVVAAMLSAGLISFGAWIVMEVRKK